MSSVSSLCLAMLWCALQVTLLATLTALLCARPWRIGGASAPFFGLCGIIAITFASFLPTPHWYTPKSISSFIAPSAELTKSDATAAAADPSDKTMEPIGTKADKKAIKTSGWDSSLQSFATALSDEFRAADATNDASKRSVYLPYAIIGLFATGAALGAIRFLVGWIGTNQLKRRGRRLNDQRLDEIMTILCAELSIKHRIELYETTQLTTAATMGAIRPVILLPVHWADWTDDELQAVLAHELAHVSHRDFAMQLLSQIGVVLHFYNPVIHWLSGRLRLEQELAADSCAAKIAGGNRRYVQLLAKLALDHENQNVGWPARAFLPTQQTFLRRLEMLRNAKTSPATRLTIGRWAALAMIGMASIAVIGFKPQSMNAVSAMTPVADTPTGTFDLRYVSDEGGLVIALRPAEILREPKVAKLAELLNETPLPRVQREFGIELKDIDQFVIGIRIEVPSNDLSSPMRSSPYSSIYLKTLKPMQDLQTVLKNAGAAVVSTSESTVELPDGNFVWQPDRQTLVVNSQHNIQRFQEGRKADTRLFDSSVWNEIKDQSAVVIADGVPVRSVLNAFRQQPNAGAMMLPLFSPIVDEAKTMGIALSATKEFKVRALVACTDKKGTEVVSETATSSIVFMKNGLREAQRAFASSQKGLSPNDLLADPTLNPSELVSQLLKIGNQILDSTKVTTNESSVSLTAGVSMDSIPMEPITSALSAARKAAQRMQSTNNLKQIALAFHNHESAFRKLPESKYIANGKTHPHSWRVAILPFIEQVELYNQYKFDEPWDSESNLKLLAKMPAVYRHPDAAPGSTETNYVLLVGKDLVFGDGPAKFERITDGTSNTILAVEAKTNIPWTKPEDFEYSATGPLPAFGGFSAEGFNAAFVDGSVRFMSKTLDEKTLRSVITARGGEVITGL